MFRNIEITTENTIFGEKYNISCTELETNAV